MGCILASLPQARCAAQVLYALWLQAQQAAAWFRGNFQLVAWIRLANVWASLHWFGDRTQL